MRLADQLTHLTETMAAAEGLRAETVAKRVFGTGTTLKRLRDGRSITTDRYEASVAWFSAHWPAGTPWPDAVLRPAAAPTEA